jgi:hypothetical protein
MNEIRNFKHMQKNRLLVIADVSGSPLFDYIKCPLHRYTFQVKNIREWTENNCEGKNFKPICR